MLSCWNREEFTQGCFSINSRCHTQARNNRNDIVSSLDGDKSRLRECQPCLLLFDRTTASAEEDHRQASSKGIADNSAFLPPTLGMVTLIGFFGSRNLGWSGELKPSSELRRHSPYIS